MVVSFSATVAGSIDDLSMVSTTLDDDVATTVVVATAFELRQSTKVHLLCNSEVLGSDSWIVVWIEDCEVLHFCY